MSASPFGLLVTAASDSNASVERLVRAALLVSRAMEDEAMTAWCTRELNGYDGEAVPVYRKLPAILMGIGPYGRHAPIRFAEPDVMEMVGTSTARMALAEVATYASAKEGAEFRIMFSPELEQVIRGVVPAAQSAYHLVQRVAFASLLSGARQHVFNWAMEHIHQRAVLPPSVDLKTILGLPSHTEETAPAEARAGIDFSHAQLSGNVQFVVGSPNSSLSQSGVDPEILSKLIQVLEGASKAANDGSADSLAGPLNELKALASMSKPREHWIKESLKTLRTVLEGASGALLAELSKPHVQGLLAQVLHST